MIALRISILVLIATTGACSAAPTDRPPEAVISNAHEAAQKKTNESNLIESEWFIDYAQKRGDKYGEVRIYRDGRHIRSLGDTYGAYEKELPPPTSGSGNIILLHQVDSGIAEASDGKLVRHDRYYCTFVDLRDGCVLERRTGEFCSGSWASDNQWIDFDNRLTDMGEKRITADEVIRFNHDPAEGAVWNYENLSHCDQVGPENKHSYGKILDKNIFSLPRDELQSAQKRLKKVSN